MMSSLTFAARGTERESDSRQRFRYSRAQRHAGTTAIDPSAVLTWSLSHSVTIVALRTPSPRIDQRLTKLPE